MEKNKIFAVGAIALLAFALGVFAYPKPVESVGKSDDSGLEGRIEVFKNGILVATTKNTVTSLATNYTRDALGLDAVAHVYLNITNITLSNSTAATAITDATCVSTINDSIGFESKRGAVAKVDQATPGNYSVTVTFTATERTDSISKVCLQNTSGTWLFASGLLSPTVSVDNGDTLTVNYYLAVKNT